MQRFREAALAEACWREREPPNELHLVDFCELTSHFNFARLYEVLWTPPRVGDPSFLLGPCRSPGPIASVTGSTMPG